MQNLAQSYDGLNRSQKATIDQFVAGKFQINILKSVLGDLSTVNNEYNRAQQVSANATDQAIQKNQQLYLVKQLLDLDLQISLERHLRMGLH